MKARSLLHWAGTALLITVVAACLGTVAFARTTVSARSQASTLTSIGPSGLRFYTPPRHLPPGPHGTLIWARPLHGVAALHRATNELVLYTQRGIHGKLVAVSGIVSIPRGKPPRRGWPVVTFAHGTSGIADQCAPSRDTGRNSGAHGTDADIAPLLNRWITDGYAVLRTDYEGLGGPGPHPYLIGRSEGYSVLDMVRAARQFDPALSRRVIISGWSQGGHAALWAAALAPRYTPDLHLLGTVAFAPQSHTATEVGLLSTQTTPALTPLAAMILRGIDIADRSLHVSSVLTPAGATLYPQTLTRCLHQLGSKRSFGGLPLDQLVSPSANLAPLAAAIARSDPDNLKIKGPVLLEQGLADTTVLPPLDTLLSKSLAKAGDKVTYHTYPGATHATVLIKAALDATGFLKHDFGR